MPKPKRTCSVADCGKPCRGHGYCNAHYQRWVTHGDPLGGGTAWGEPMRYLNENVLTYEGDDCLKWPYATKGGYGKMVADGKQWLVSRKVCTIVHGPAPTPEHEAAHSCGQGHEGCCTKGHLSWKTPVQNAADKLIHGTSPRGENCGTVKLTEAAAREVLRLKGKMLHKEIASRFGISRQQVDRIINRQRWAWLEAGA